MYKIYDIAVIGESMAGKSTWISQLFDKTISKKLRTICTLNQEGQTKIPVHYRLICPDKLEIYVSSIEFQLETLSDRLEEKNADVIKLAELLKLPDTDLEDHVRSSEFTAFLRELDAIELIDSVCNNTEIEKLGVISCIEICGSADSDIWKEMQKFDLDCVKIRDTRGFLDETAEKMQEYFERKKEQEKNLNLSHMNKTNEESEDYENYLQKLTDDRGLCGVDACIFMSVGGSNALLKKNSKSIYGPLIINLLKKTPTFLVIRTDKLAEILLDNPNMSYEDAISRDDEKRYKHFGKVFTGFNDLRVLLKDYGLYDKSDDYHISIARKHHNELMLPNLSLDEYSSESDISEFEGIYRKATIGVFRNILNRVCEYFKNISTAERFLESIRNFDEFSEMKKIFDNLFDSKIFFHSQDWGYANRNLGYVTSWLSKKIQGDYYGGMVGPRGGFTTWISGEGRVGAASIDLLESAYKIRSSLYAKLVDRIIQLAKESLDSSISDDLIEESKEKLWLYYTRKIEHSWNSFSCTNRMIPTHYLKPSYDKTRKDLDVQYDFIGNYLPELENLFNDSQWCNDRHQISVVKHILWLLVSAAHKDSE